MQLQAEPMEKIDLLSLSGQALEEFIKAEGLPAFRARQLIHWIYEKNVTGIGEITEFAKPLREKLAAKAYIGGLQVKKRLVSEDGTEKYLFGLRDGNEIESVLMGAETECTSEWPDRAPRFTLCVSSQVGCALGCRFCLTGRMGFIRDLSAHEIVGQVLAAGRIVSPRKITNLVFMGMGEPLTNLGNVAEALRRITSFLRISGRRITLSTSGIIPAIRELPRVAPMVNLAVSLNAATDEVRSAIMPVNRRFGLPPLIAALRQFPLPQRGRITFEYVLLGGVNDAAEDALRLVKLLRGLKAKVNLIPFNAHTGAAFSAPSPDRVLAFQKILVDGRLPAFIRKSRGADILAACGQLKAGY
ncbi:MAG: 23S rRNA (adenine(2503)-C(2))-methyltransferase RlmN [Nitrospiraceae bacterium]|nr:23S rRNA (adenine(2503)-C(2))-methyltransferase RlmN [Nitrospiraceae bacterium]